MNFVEIDERQTDLDILKAMAGVYAVAILYYIISGRK